MEFARRAVEVARQARSAANHRLELALQAVFAGALPGAFMELASGAAFARMFARSGLELARRTRHAQAGAAAAAPCVL
jgi:hypothetical protein